MRAIAMLLAVVLAGCYTSVSARNHPMITLGEGATARIGLERSTVSGELLEIADTALLVKTRRHVVLIPASAVVWMRFTGLSNQYDRKEAGERPLAAMRHLSRYPGGIPPEALQALLRRSKQTAPRVRVR